MPKFAEAGVFVWELEVAWGANGAVSHPWQTMTAADTQWFLRRKSLQTLTELWPSQQQHLCPCEDGFMHWGKTALADALSFSSLLSYFIKLAVSKLTRLPVSCGGVMLWYEPQELFKESSKYICLWNLFFRFLLLQVCVTSTTRTLNCKSCYHSIDLLFHDFAFSQDKILLIKVIAGIIGKMS